MGVGVPCNVSGAGGYLLDVHSTDIEGEFVEAQIPSVLRQLDSGNGQAFHQNIPAVC